MFKKVTTELGTITIREFSKGSVIYEEGIRKERVIYYFLGIKIYDHVYSRDLNISSDDKESDKNKVGF